MQRCKASRARVELVCRHIASAVLTKPRVPPLSAWREHAGKSGIDFLILAQTRVDECLVAAGDQTQVLRQAIGSCAVPTVYQMAARRVALVHRSDAMRARAILSAVF
jgi:hypothetical protein